MSEHGNHAERDESTVGFQPADVPSVDGAGNDDGDNELEPTTNERETLEAMARYNEHAELAFRLRDGEATDDEIADAVNEYGGNIGNTFDTVRAMLDTLYLGVDSAKHEVSLLLATGGPHYEIRWTQGEHGQAEDVWFLAMPWFDRVEVRDVPSGIVGWADYYAEMIDSCYENGVEDLTGYDEEEWAHGDESDEDRCARILDEAMDNLERTYQLVYVDYRDELTDEQIVKILDGRINGELDDVTNEVDECFWEARSDNAYDAAFAAIGEQDDIDFLREHDEGSFEDILLAVQERDESDIFGDLLRNTGMKVFRYDLNLDVSPSLDMDDDELDEAVVAIAAAAGIDLNTHNAIVILNMIQCATYGGHLYVIWQGDVEDIVNATTAKVWRNDESDITFTNPTLLILDQLNGSGMECSVEGTIVRRFDPALAHLDTGQSYGWSDIIGGVSHNAYRTSVTFSEVSNIDVEVVA